MSASSAAFAGFAEHTVPVHSTALGRALDIFVRTGGAGPPLLLLHGYPQSSHMWNKIAGRLSEQYSLVIPDLRGYGRSDKPPGSASHVEYSKREMAADQAQVMTHFGHAQFSVVGHDRGARVGARLAWDHPDRVQRLLTLDIAPTLWMYEHTDMAFASGYWHWFFLIQPAPGPEDVIAGAPDAFWAMLQRRHAPAFWSAADVAEYRARFFAPAAVHATCEDYRAAASIDLEHDRADLAAGKKISVRALRALWGAKGIIAKMGGAVDPWKACCAEGTKVSGRALDCGHFMPEERPEEVLDEILAFMA